MAQTTLPHPSTVQRQPIARPIEPAKPEETFAARVADVPDTPPTDVVKDDPPTGEAVFQASKPATTSSDDVATSSASSSAVPPAIAPPASAAEAAKGKA